LVTNLYTRTCIVDDTLSIVLNTSQKAHLIHVNELITQRTKYTIVVSIPRCFSHAMNFLIQVFSVSVCLTTWRKVDAFQAHTFHVTLRFSSGSAFTVEQSPLTALKSSRNNTANFATNSTLPTIISNNAQVAVRSPASPPLGSSRAPAVTTSTTTTTSTSTSTVTVIESLLDSVKSKFYSNNLVNSNSQIKSDSSSTTPSTPLPVKTKSLSIILCPAQFCVPADYTDLIDNLQSYFENENPNKDIKLQCARVVPLPRSEWIKVAQSIPTQDYWNGTLRSRNTLSWYYQAIEQALNDVLSDPEVLNDPNHSICIIGHSIGGWIARGWLGGLACSSTAVHRIALSRVSSLLTLGTPHSCPPDALVDQTRGLLAEVARTPTCSSQHFKNVNIEVTTVCSKSIKAQLNPLRPEQILGALSYWPQLNSLDNVYGDGIVPLQLGLMDEPANRIVLDSKDTPIGHAHVVPTPWNLLQPYSPSLKLPESYLWYGSRDVLREWASYIK